MKGSVSGPRPANPRIYNSVVPGSVPQNPLTEQSRRNFEVASERSLPFEALNTAVQQRHMQQIQEFANKIAQMLLGTVPPPSPGSYVNPVKDGKP